MSSSLAGKVALITGGSKGIGAATALNLAKDGASIVISYSSDSEPAEEVISHIGPERAIAVKGDAGNLADIDNLVKATTDRFGKIDVLIPNAGILNKRTLESTAPEDFDTTYNLNVKGVYFLCQKALPHMASGSHIILISTSLTHSSTITPEYLLYVSTKGAIEQMIRIMAKDLGKRGINVNCVAPGPTTTDLFLSGLPEAALKMIESNSPFGRIGEAQEIADMIAILASEKSRWISGQTLLVNGALIV
ncbi:MAG: hypothetical protein Q9160_004263 [Pyrenula sp. 1 TL-2023]